MLDWVKTCMEIRIECRRLVGRPRKAWLENVEADVSELEIDRENIHARKKWKRNVMKRKSNPWFPRYQPDKIPGLFQDLSKFYQDQVPTSSKVLCLFLHTSTHGYD